MKTGGGLQGGLVEGPRPGGRIVTRRVSAATMATCLTRQGDLETDLVTLCDPSWTLVSPGPRPMYIKTRPCGRLGQETIDQELGQAISHPCN